MFFRTLAFSSVCMAAMGQAAAERAAAMQAFEMLAPLTQAYESSRLELPSQVLVKLEETLSRQADIPGMPSFSPRVVRLRVAPVPEQEAELKAYRESIATTVRMMAAVPGQAVAAIGFPEKGVKGFLIVVYRSKAPGEADDTLFKATWLSGK